MFPNFECFRISKGRIRDPHCICFFKLTGNDVIRDVTMSVVYFDQRSVLRPNLLVKIDGKRRLLTEIADIYRIYSRISREILVNFSF